MRRWRAAPAAWRTVVGAGSRLWAIAAAARRRTRWMGARRCRHRRCDRPLAPDHLLAARCRRRAIIVGIAGRMRARCSIGLSALDALVALVSTRTALAASHRLLAACGVAKYLPDLVFGRRAPESRRSSGRSADAHRRTSSRCSSRSPPRRDGVAHDPMAARTSSTFSGSSSTKQPRPIAAARKLRTCALDATCRRERGVGGASCRARGRAKPLAGRRRLGSTARRAPPPQPSPRRHPARPRWRQESRIASLPGSSLPSERADVSRSRSATSSAPPATSQPRMRCGSKK